jgi:hypothetical protein
MAKEPERSHRGGAEKAGNFSDSKKPATPPATQKPSTPPPTKKK